MGQAPSYNKQASGQVKGEAESSSSSLSSSLSLRAEGKPQASNLILLLVFALCLLIGIAGTWHVVWRQGWQAPPRILPRLILVWICLAPVTLAFNFGLRFLRWRLLLRSTEINLPERFSLCVYLASFAFNFTPLYLGPTLYRVLALGRTSNEPVFRRKALGVSIAEVFYDGVSLAVVGLLGAAFDGHGGASLWGLALIVLLALWPAARQGLALAYCVLINLAGRLLFKRTGELPAASFARVFATPRFVPALLLGVMAWLAPPFFFFALERAAGHPAHAAAALRSVAEGTLFGSLSASPGGTGVTGSMIYRDAKTYDHSVAPAVIFFYRLGTWWLGLVIGGFAALHGMKPWRERPPAPREHFEQIAALYDAEIPESVRLRLLERKTAVMLAQLPPGPLRGFDLGCGQGHYAQRMAEAGYLMVGADASLEQLAAAKPRVGAVFGVDAAHLPVADQTFDFVYSINVLHHLPSRELQQQAFAEIRRILKPGGKFFLHEINTINPLFRFYMGYLFPVIRQIDTGEEHWIRPERWEAYGSCAPEKLWLPRAVYYYTFLPDFVPGWLAKILRPIEARLEQSKYRYLSAHYSAMFVKE